MNKGLISAVAIIATYIGYQYYNFLQMQKNSAKKVGELKGQENLIPKVEGQTETLIYGSSNIVKANEDILRNGKHYLPELRNVIFKIV